MPPILVGDVVQHAHTKHDLTTNPRTVKKPRFTFPSAISSSGNDSVPHRRLALSSPAARQSPPTGAVGGRSEAISPNRGYFPCAAAGFRPQLEQIGRASCRERVYVLV